MDFYLLQWLPGVLILHLLTLNLQKLVKPLFGFQRKLGTDSLRERPFSLVEARANEAIQSVKSRWLNLPRAPVLIDKASNNGRSASCQGEVIVQKPSLQSLLVVVGALAIAQFLTDFDLMPPVHPPFPVVLIQYLGGNLKLLSNESDYLRRNICACSGKSPLDLKQAE